MAIEIAVLSPQKKCFSIVILVYQGVYINLVGGFNHLEKYEFVNGKDDIPYILWKIKHIWNHQPEIL